MNSPLVSVIIPTKDRPELLVRALRSVLEQSYRNLEIIVVDDGSRPPVSLHSSMKDDDRVRILRMDSCRGPATARNIGIERSEGLLIAFLDDDDEYERDRIENAVSVLQLSAEDAALVECGHSGWLDDRLVYEYRPLRKRGLRESLLREPSVALPTVTIRRSAFDVVGVFDVSLDRYEDWDLWLRMTDVFESVAVTNVDVRRRLHYPIPAVVRLRLYSRMLRRVAPRIRTLPFSKRIALWSWHGRFFIYRVIEVLLERLAGRAFIRRLKIRRLFKSGTSV